MKYNLESAIEADRLEEQVFQSNYSLEKELRELKVDPSHKIMDAGCGTGVLSRYLVKNCGVKHVDALDGSSLRLKQAHSYLDPIEARAISFYEQDLSALDDKFKNNYDCVISRYVIEHTDKPEQMLSELKDALKPGGKLHIIELDGVFINLFTGNETLNKMLELIKSKVSFDLNIGRKIPSLMKKVGLSNIDWKAELIACKGKALEEERINTQKRLMAFKPSLLKILGVEKDCLRFEQLYLDEMMKEESTLVFTKYFCTGHKDKG